MPKHTMKPIISDEFLDEVVKEINEQFGGPLNENNLRSPHLDSEERT
ncbi:hypothetical protein [Peribacillus sp. SI8-4]|nr:hypothetical protein [Peribacillus sp. SI8-4]